VRAVSLVVAKSAMHYVHLLVITAITIHRPLKHVDTVCQLFEHLPCRLPHTHIISNHQAITCQKISMIKNFNR